MLQQFPVWLLEVGSRPIDDELEPERLCNGWSIEREYDAEDGSQVSGLLNDGVCKSVSFKF